MTALIFQRWSRAASAASLDVYGLLKGEDDFPRTFSHGSCSASASEWPGLCPRGRGANEVRHPPYEAILLHDFRRLRTRELRPARLQSNVGDGSLPVVTPLPLPKRIRRLVVERLRLRIPAQWLPEFHRDGAHVQHGAQSLQRLRIVHRFRAGFDAVEKVPLFA